MDADRPLTEVGKQQAHVMRKFLKAVNVKPDIIICSDFERAHDTAKIMQRKHTPLEFTAALRPDGDASKAWKTILKLAGDAKSVLIVTHSPLIYSFAAAVAFALIDSRSWTWTHGAILYANPQSGPQFRWFVPPKLAAHIVDLKHPKEVEAPLGEALLGRELYAEGMLAIAENLQRAHKAAAVDPLIYRLKHATARRFRRQWSRVKVAMTKLKPRWDVATYSEVRSNLQAAIVLRDPAYAKVFDAVTKTAKAAGRRHVTEQLTSPNVTRNTREAKKPIVPGVPPRTAADLEDDLDNTTDRETGNKLKDAFLDVATPIGFAAMLGQLRDQFAEYADGVDGKTSRAETVAVTEVSGAYHDGGAEAASDTDGTVLKSWDTEDDPCEDCQANSDQGEIPEDGTFDSGDDEPPAHPNCRCSVSYRMADGDEV